MEAGSEDAMWGDEIPISPLPPLYSPSRNTQIQEYHDHQIIHLRTYALQVQYTKWHLAIRKHSNIHRGGTEESLSPLRTQSHTQTSNQLTGVNPRGKHPSGEIREPPLTFIGVQDGGGGGRGEDCPKEFRRPTNSSNV